MKLKIVIFLPNVIGGVATAVNNYLNEIETNLFSVSIVKTEDILTKRPKIAEEFPNAFNIDFKYSHRENAISVYKRLRKLVADDDTIILATDRLELEMAHYFNLKNRIVYWLLGDFQYYYQLAINHSSVIDKYITISNDINSNLIKLLPKREMQIVKCRLSVPEVKIGIHNAKQILKVIFVGRLESGKGINLLPEIDKSLKNHNIIIEWTIVGDGELKETIKNNLKDYSNITFKGFLDYGELFSEYIKHDIFFLPSLSEGMPLSLIESMKTGLVPVVSDIPGGVREIIKHGETGFMVAPSDVIAFANTIKLLDENRALLASLKHNARQSSIELFNAKKNTVFFFNEIVNIKREKQPGKTNFKPTNRLDKFYIPNLIVKLLRTARK